MLQKIFLRQLELILKESRRKYLDTVAMNIEPKAGEDGKITTAGKLDIDIQYTYE